jgi:hypothetical protein
MEVCFFTLIMKLFLISFNKSKIYFFYISVGVYFAAIAHLL